MEFEEGVITVSTGKDVPPELFTPVTNREYLNEGFNPEKLAVVEVEEEGTTSSGCFAGATMALSYTGGVGVTETPTEFSWNT